MLKFVDMITLCTTVGYACIGYSRDILDMLGWVAMATNRGLQDIQNLMDVIFKYLIVVYRVMTPTNFNIFPGGPRAGYAQIQAVIFSSMPSNLDGDNN
jgi:hypothetical protein